MEKKRQRIAFLTVSWYIIMRPLCRDLYRITDFLSIRSPTNKRRNVHSPATCTAAGTADWVWTGRATSGSWPAVGPWGACSLAHQFLRRRISWMCWVWRPTTTVAVRSVPTPSPILPVKVPVNHTGQRKRFPGASLVARLWCLKATGAPTVGVVESNPTGRRSPTSSRRSPCGCAGSGASSNSANDSSTDSWRYGCTTSTGGTRATSSAAKSPLSCIPIIFRFVVTLAVETATRTLVMSVGTVIIRPIPTFSTPNRHEEGVVTLQSIKTGAAIRH